VAKSEFESKAEQLRSQIEDLRSSLDDLLNSYNKLLPAGAALISSLPSSMKQMAQQAGAEAENVGENLTPGGFSWWVPVAVVGAIGIGAWLYNTLMSGSQSNAPSGSESSTQFGSQSGMRSGSQPSGSEPHPPPTSFTNYQAGNQPPFTSTESPFNEPRSER
jgi:hypothetical protein